ncbi:haloacid dehalogenase type II [Kocuria sediminis]|uniref:Haloacid dehalogenase type II n=1 Tax=Kocuria sediminis TaxID=1038857 RepID=A0A6N8GG69_9MICC|nr:haloacid dehalogenase type II [Kocuria sediminis]MUN62161.1 haloacid dehalogenase type II [Kocuria sediminis]
MTADERPVLVFDVNETLSDTGPLHGVFEELGLPGPLAQTWLSGVLREGFALAVHGESQPFAVLGEAVARSLFAVHAPDRQVEEAVRHVREGMQRLPVHPDVAPGIQALADAGFRIVALTNGSEATAEGLLERGGVRQHFEHVLSVDDAPCWKPAPEAYAWASGVWGLPLERALMIAANPWDLHGAARAGMRTAWMDRHGAPWPGYARAPDLRVSGVRELAARLCGDAVGLRA